MISSQLITLSLNLFKVLQIITPDWKQRAFSPESVHEAAVTWKCRGKWSRYGVNFCNKFRRKLKLYCAIPICPSGDTLLNRECKVVLSGMSSMEQLLT